MIEQALGKLLKAGCCHTADLNSRCLFLAVPKKKCLSFENFTLQHDLELSLIKTKNTSELIGTDNKFRTSHKMLQKSFPSESLNIFVKCLK